MKSSFVKKTCSILLSSVILLSQMPAGAFAEENVSTEVHISTVKDFAEFAENCTFDSFSVGKTFILDKDIMFSADSFVSVPSFGGTFDGRGHKISGADIRGSASNTGLFRYIEKSGVVKDLNVSGYIMPSGQACNIGGIAGVNNGSVRSCTFEGSVSGKENVGGIAGTNNGFISSVTVKGNVEGDHCTGGAVGMNHGYITNTVNMAEVNTQAEDVNVSLSTLEDLSITDVTAPEKVTSTTDTGGIAGVSEGNIIACTNRGNVGYAHFGYNIGGIAGRQKGYISGCENFGTINGRKDIGGICGQSEPFTSLFVSKGSAEKLRNEIGSLTNEIDRSLYDIRRNKDSLGSDADRLIESLDQLKDAGHTYMDNVDSIVNDNVSTLNELSARVSDVISMAQPVSDKLSEAANDFSRAFSELKDAAEIVGKYTDDADSSLKTLRPVLDDLSSVSDSLKKGADDLQNALASVKASVGDADEMRAALSDLGDALDELITDLDTLSDSISNIIDSTDLGDPALSSKLSDLKNQLELLSSYSDKLSKDLTNKRIAVEQLKEKLRTQSGDIDWDSYRVLLAEIIDIDHEAIEGFFSSLSGTASELSKTVVQATADIWEDIQKASDSIDRIKNELTAFGYTHNGDPAVRSARERINSAGDAAINDIYDVVDFLNSALDDTSEIHSDANDIIDRVKTAWDFLSESEADLVAAAYAAADAGDNCAKGTSVIEEAFDILSDVHEYISSKAELIFTGAGDEIISTRDEIKMLAGNFLDAADSFSSSAGAGIETVSADLHDINVRLDSISNIIIDMVNEVQSTSTDVSEYIEDISRTDSSGQTPGKIISCTNRGRVEGDLNIGGVTGTMGIDNPMDPEGDLQLPENISPNFVYKSRTIIRESRNYGTVTSKRDGAGGIAGNMETGCVFTSESYGDVRSTDGSYVGGIAGKSSSVIVGSYVFCRLNGNDYVGGIAGSGHDISACRSFVEIDETNEYRGAVAGAVNGEASENFFVDNGTGGIDGVSYAAKAAPLKYEDFMKLEGIPSEFGKISLIFAIVDDDGNISEEVERFTTFYGSRITQAEIPAVPEKNGFYGYWEDFEHNDLRFSRIIPAVYKKLVTTIGSGKDAQGKQKILVEGSFTEETKLIAEQQGSEWKVTLPDDEVHTIRFLSQYDNPELIVNGERVHFERDGSYLVFSTSGNFAIMELEKTDDKMLITAAAAGGSAVFIVIMIAIAAIRRKRRKKKAVKHT